MIVTVTLNAALDRTLVVPGFRPGESRTVQQALSLGGGKGLNVARALHTLGAPLLALGFAGGPTGELIRRGLDEEGLPHDLTPIRANSRTCTAIVDPESGIASEINEPGAVVTDDESKAFLDRFQRALPQARLIALSGSVARGLPVNFYARLIELARSAGVPCLLDTRDEALHAGMQAAPLLAKPNQHEAADLFGGSFDPLHGAHILGALPRPGPALLAITLGAEGAVLYAPAGAWYARPPIVHAIDTVGAGDSFVAGLAAALLQASGNGSPEAAIGEPATLEAMLRLATATAAANALTVGAGRFDPADMSQLLERVELRQIATG